MNDYKPFHGDYFTPGQGKKPSQYKHSIQLFTLFVVSFIIIVLLISF